MSHDDDDYLWDKSGTPDPGVEKLERSLARFRHAPRKFEAPRRVAPVHARPSIRAQLALAASIALVAGAALFFGLRPQSGVAGSMCAVTGLEGVSRAGGSVVRPESGAVPVAPGDEVITTDGSRARIELASGIGHVDVEPGTRVRVEEIHEQQQRLSLAEGKISAQVVAVPRLFIVDTPAARAVDLGCAYTLAVDSAGNGHLAVTSGRVELAATAVVPAGASCAIRAGFGPGTPYWTDASDALRAALERADFENGGAAAVGDVIREARGRDALTLVHLLYDAPASAMPALYAKLASISPPPAGVSEPDVMKRQRFALDAWRDRILEGADPSWNGFDPSLYVFPGKKTDKKTDE